MTRANALGRYGVTATSTPGGGYIGVVPKVRRLHCKLCGASREQAQISKTGLCYACSLRRVNAMLRYYLSGDPESLIKIEDEEFARANPEAGN